MNTRPLSRAERRVGPSSLRPSEASESQRVTAQGVSSLEALLWAVGLAFPAHMRRMSPYVQTLDTRSHRVLEIRFDVWRLSVDMHAPLSLYAVERRTYVLALLPHTRCGPWILL